MDHKGKVSAQNIYDMCKHLGLNANPKECEAVLASADRKGNGYLGPDDFLDLIYNDLDLLALPDLKLPGASTIVPSQDVPAMLQSLSAIAKQQRDNRHFNQVKYVLKNRLTNLIKDFKRNVERANQGHRREQPADPLQLRASPEEPEHQRQGHGPR
jgi:hypothetical protein